MAIGVQCYIHGYSEDEAVRLADQARTLADLLHHDTRYAPGSLVLEAGCGTGAQTREIVERCPGISLVSVDLSAASLRAARARGLATELVRGEIASLPFRDGSFDHVFVCFVLEHLADPEGALRALRRLIRPGGTITVIEGDHGSCYYHPATPAAASRSRSARSMRTRACPRSRMGSCRRRSWPWSRESGNRTQRSGWSTPQHSNRGLPTSGPRGTGRDLLLHLLPGDGGEGAVKVSVVLGHPSPGSFNHALAEAACGTLAGCGHQVVLHDLYTEGFEPLLPGDEVLRGACLDPVIAAHCEEIAAADGIVVVHPNWWGMPPAILAGWVDRVLRPGVAYRFFEGDGGEGVPEGLLRARAALVLNTANTSGSREAEVFGDPLDMIWRRCVFALCGVPVVERAVYRVVVTSTPAERATWLDDARERVRRLFPSGTFQP